MTSFYPLQWFFKKALALHPIGAVSFPATVSRQHASFDKLLYGTFLCVKELNKSLQRHDDPSADIDYRLAIFAFKMRLQSHKIDADQLSGDVDGADAVSKKFLIHRFVPPKILWIRIVQSYTIAGELYPRRLYHFSSNR